MLSPVQLVENAPEKPSGQSGLTAPNTGSFHECIAFELALHPDAKVNIIHTVFFGKRLPNSATSSIQNKNSQAGELTK